MELKSALNEANKEVAERLNRTFMELKSNPALRQGSSNDGLNRTFMELKFSMRLYTG